MLIDSHCHLDRLDLTPYNGDLSAALAAARELDVEHFVSVGITLTEADKLIHIADQFSNVSISVGEHPTENPTVEITATELKKWLEHPKVVAIGETGLDYYRVEGDMAWQQERFRTHIRVAKEFNKPIIVHSRLAKEDTLRILQEEDAAEIGGVLHCFTEDLDMALRAIELNFYISFSGILTFKNATELQATAKALPLERILVETDSPYLAPVPYRGKPNFPAYVRYTAEYLAELRGESFAQVAKQTSENCCQLFKLSIQAPSTC